MYSPKELEGEVDHSFFDSDCELNEHKSSKDGQLSKQKASERHDERTGKETHVSMNQIGDGVHNGGNNEDKTRFEGASNHQASRRQSQDTSAKSRSDEGSSVRSYSSDEDREPEADFKQRKTNGNVNSDEDDDGYHHSDEESEEDARSSATRSAKQKGMPKKTAGKIHRQSRSHSTSSSDSESSHSSEERSTFRSRKSPVKHQRTSSADQKERQKETAESEDTVTDVTPLSTPNISPSQSIDVTADVQQQPGFTEEKLADDVSDGQASISSEGENGPEFLKVDKHFDRVLMVSSPASVVGSRKNYSFTNEKVREIDRENQRLLHELSRASSRSHSARSPCSKMSSRRSSAPTVRLYHSALNRQREQERIQKENLAFLKRLESVKPTPGITRDEQLADYQRQCRYMGTHNTDIPLVNPKTSGRTSRPGSSPHKTRPETAKLHRVKPRPAWS
ncbi:cilia- and flagella-associated protein 97 isoform X1 [Danio rerio]|uniref:Cilia- and flagella-associated protein 97 n=1 Tax=Danio rerio TaxID=7955 RepID=B8JIG1_DANRE|nr:cilia- and flagella-associated protein 97 isoform X1 [Danio rerio]|eukprot:XP_005168395.1 cilia- and flagella-associated protein 97 isoform X1 [Danio rerio]